MSVSRFCVPFHPGAKDIWIDGAETHHMLRVKRLGMVIGLFYLTAWEMNAAPRSSK